MSSNTLQIEARIGSPRAACQGLSVPARVEPLPAHIPALDGLRGAAILLVLFTHAYGAAVTAQTAEPREFLTKLVSAAGGCCWAGVDLFFVLSGFLITGILLDSKGHPHYFRNFYARRTLRIFPLYYLALLLRLTVLHGWRPLYNGERWCALFYVSNFWQSAVPYDAHFDVWLGVNWSLAVEEQFYLVWPLLLWLLPRRAVLPACALLACLSTALRVPVWGWSHYGAYSLTPCRLEGFAAGAAVAVLARRFGREALVAPARWVALASASILLVVLLAQGSGSALQRPMALFGYPAIDILFASLLALALAPGALAAGCACRGLRLFGKYSYAIYLVHFPILLFLPTWLAALQGHARWWPGLRHAAPFLQLPENRALAILLLWTAGSALSLTVAWFCWHLYEKHWLRLKRYFPS